MGCHATHIFNNLCYPLLILPYFFRAFRIKKIYDQATMSGIGSKDLNIFKSARTPSMLSTNLHLYGNVEVTGSRNGTAIQSITPVLSASNLAQAAREGRMNRSNSVTSVANDSSFNFEDALAFSQALDKRLIKWFILCMMPFVFMSIL